MNALPPGARTSPQKVGYARVSTSEQHLDMQFAALKKAGCDMTFFDHGISGTTYSRPGLDSALEYVQPGDTFVVLRVDRLGRSVHHLAQLLIHFRKSKIRFNSLTEGIDTASSCANFTYHLQSSFSQYYRDVIRENTIRGLEAARKRGSRIGRPRLLDDYTILRALNDIKTEGLSVAKAAERLGVSRSTLSRGIKRVFPTLETPADAETREN